MLNTAGKRGAEVTDKNGKIYMAHGSGGKETAELVKNMFAGVYGNEYLAQMEDATLLYGSKRIVMTTDSFVVDPPEFPGGNIGRLAVCGTVNDIVARGAVPKYLSAAFILGEGLEFELLERVIKSMAETADEAGVKIVCGDTKVIEGKGSIYINTTGIGFIPERKEAGGENDFATESDAGVWVPGCDKIEAGDVIIVSGNLGDHHAAILGKRLGFDNDIKSDAAPLVKIAEALREDFGVHAMRDVTRGGLATVLKEMAEASGKCFVIEEDKLPVSGAVKSFASLLGLDPLYMGNEGKMVAFVREKYAAAAAEVIRKLPYGEDACMIGNVKVAEDESEKGSLILETGIGGRRSLDLMVGEGLPRIC